MIRLLLALVLVAGCGGAAPPPSASVRIALNWFPEAEHGGYFAALVHGFYAEEGVASVDLVAGGPGVPVIPRVASGDVVFGVVNADEVVAARAAGADVVATLAPIQKSPWCVMVRADSGITRFAELRGLTVAMQAGTPYVEWLEHTGVLAGVHIVPYGGSIVPFLASANHAQQGYVFSEPVLAASKGVAVRCLSIAETGFDPYASVLVASRATLDTRSDLVAAMTLAAVRGWQRYLVDPAATHQEILARNPEIGRHALDEGARALGPLVATDTTRREGIGSMDAARWTALAQQMHAIGAIDRAVDASSLFDGRFVPRPADS